MGTQQFCLKWNNHQVNMVTVFDQLLSSEALVDVTLACEGLSLKAHKIILSACSPFFQSLFLENPCKHPIVILKDMKYAELKAIVEFIYRGEVNVSHDQLSALLKTAEMLNIRGLAEVASDSKNKDLEKDLQKEVVQQQPVNTTISSVPVDQVPSRPTLTSATKRKRNRIRRRSSSDSNSSDEDVPSKIKEPESPEIIEEILPESVNDSHKQLSVSTNSQYPVSSCQSQDTVSQQKTQSSSVLSQHNTYINVDEPCLGNDRNYVDSSNLLEQLMTTEPMPVFRENHSQSSNRTPISSQITIPTCGLTDSHSVHIGPSSNESQILASCSTPSEASTSNCLSQDIQDVKPVSMLTFEEPSISPAASISNKDSSNSMPLYVDNSGISSLPGPSNYQLDKQSSQLSHQPQSHVESMDSSRCLDRAGETTVKCSICDMLFKSKQGLNLHLRRSHQIKGKYQCDICTRSYSQRCDLYSHRKIHGGISHHSCAVCSKKFIYLSALRRHLRMKH
ncbi:protein tramtrack, beta isoform-like isoform X3 [Centruroides vittatus]|uniref:protein tramtrack, beta isoform-like isoform X3 n=1 Tax=Centruroides vittatus TaxID=120091 RepID=UPI00350EFED2